MPSASALPDQPMSSGSDSDSDFDPEKELKKNPAALLKEFVDDWIASLPREDRKMSCRKERTCCIVSPKISL